MGHSTPVQLNPDDYQLSALGDGPLKFRRLVGLLGLIAAGLGLFLGITSDHPEQFAMSWLVGSVFVTSIGLGGLFFVLIQFLVKAGWSVTVRRIAEIAMMVIPFGGILLAPVVILTAMGWAGVFPWADIDWAKSDFLTGKKVGYLNSGFFVVRMAGYFALWMWLTGYFYKRSVEQDTTGDPELTRKMQWMAAPGMLLFALSVSFFSFDILMSSDPHWFSTMFGVYLFAGCHLSLLCVLAIVCGRLMKHEQWKKVLTIEHLHDIGKLMFGFVFFWGYIAFSQYMLYWYANIAETVHWYILRSEGAWGVLVMALLVGHLIVPFGGLVSRHVKRNPKTLAFWGCFLLVFHAIDLYWLARPNLDCHAAHLQVEFAAGGGGGHGDHAAEAAGHGGHAADHAGHAAEGAGHAAADAAHAAHHAVSVFGVVDLLAVLAPILLGLWYAIGIARRSSLLAVRDPRLGESLNHVNV